jgi:hypothetical protein
MMFRVQPNDSAPIARLTHTVPSCDMPEFRGYTMQRSFMLSFSTAATLFAVNAAADAANLIGSYAYSTTQVCLYGTAGFNANFQAIGTSNTSTNSIEGVWTFNGNGMGEIMQAGMSLDLPPTIGFLPSASSDESSGRITYTVAGDTFTTQHVPGTFKGTVLSGPRTGQTFTLEGVPELAGYIALGDRTLSASDTTPGVQTLTYSDGTVLHRVCHRSITAIKVSP